MTTSNQPRVRAPWYMGSGKVSTTEMFRAINVHPEEVQRVFIAAARWSRAAKSLARHWTRNEKPEAARLAAVHAEIAAFTAWDAVNLSASMLKWAAADLHWRQVNKADHVYMPMIEVRVALKQLGIDGVPTYLLSTGIDEKMTLTNKKPDLVDFIDAGYPTVDRYSAPNGIRYPLFPLGNDSSLLARMTSSIVGDEFAGDIRFLVQAHDQVHKKRAVAKQLRELEQTERERSDDDPVTRAIRREMSGSSEGDLSLWTVRADLIRCALEAVALVETDNSVQRGMKAAEFAEYKGGSMTGFGRLGESIAFAVQDPKNKDALKVIRDCRAGDSNEQVDPAIDQLRGSMAEAASRFGVKQARLKSQAAKPSLFAVDQLSHDAVASRDNSQLGLA